MINSPSQDNSLGAYTVPWVVSRVDPSHPRLILRGSEKAEFVRIYRDDILSTQAPALRGHILPGGFTELCLCGASLDDISITVAWFRPTDGLEYLWRFVVN